MNRVRVINRPDTTVAAPPVVVTPKMIEIAQGAKDEEVAITGNSLFGTSAAPINRTDVKSTLEDIKSDGTTAKVKFTVDDNAALGDFLLQIGRPNDPSWTVPVRILPAVPKVIPPSVVPDIEQTKTATVKITGRFLKGGAVCTALPSAKVACEPSPSDDGKAADLTVTPQYGAPLGKAELTIVRNGQKGDKTVEIKVVGGTPVFTPDPSKASIKTTPATETITMKLTGGDFLKTSTLEADGALKPLVKITPIGSVNGDRGAEVAEFRIEFSAKPAVGAYSFSVMNGGKTKAIPLQIVQ